MRINARLDRDCTEKLRQIQKLTQLGVSDVVKRAIDLLHRRELGGSMQRRDNILASGFIGCAEGPEDLAENHKQYLSRGFGEKHGVG